MRVPRRFSRALLALLACALPMGWPTPSASAAPAPLGTPRTCASAASALLVPACGVWWGIWPRADATGRVTNDLPANLESTEQAIGRRLDLVSRYKGWGEDVYDAWDASFRDGGRIVLEDLTARD